VPGTEAFSEDQLFAEVKPGPAQQGCNHRLSGAARRTPRDAALHLVNATADAVNFAQAVERAYGGLRVGCGSGTLLPIESFGFSWIRPVHHAAEYPLDVSVCGPASFGPMFEDTTIDYISE
jgi:hypothetical protein